MDGQNDFQENKQKKSKKNLKSPYTGLLSWLNF
ncbi:hypothetical protein N474_18005 [Pseudoalteromonas luteoviolacea CPMOR-2]|uniref:Uncharacterized protein n=1 Tax=Pseudoalteromonas luteoviolacea DSM 6061 TaxID=1365250 RepID=A0A166W6H0_9GAMM|nr:hypothetical protein N475_18320 [Pseudoalteromonas luteoviolacea DSM 6061]KZN54245.1 hypothetical protein N474_18005 [Pseudoalteromonas luteoviolacea CPMOR-2]